MIMSYDMYIYIQYIYIYLSILNVVCLLKGKKKAERHDCFSMPRRCSELGRGALPSVRPW